MDYSVVRRSSILAIQIFDERKFKNKDQGFLGIVNMTGGDALDYASARGGAQPFFDTEIVAYWFYRSYITGPREVQQQDACIWEIIILL